MQSIVDSSHAVNAEEILVRGGAMAVGLQTHIQSLVLGNTEEGSRMKSGNWTLYCSETNVYGKHPGYQGCDAVT